MQELSNTFHQVVLLLSEQTPATKNVALVPQPGNFKCFSGMLVDAGVSPELIYQVASQVQPCSQPLQGGDHAQHTGDPLKPCQITEPDPLAIGEVGGPPPPPENHMQFMIHQCQVDSRS